MQPLGRVESVVDDKFIVTRSTPMETLDLDNFVTDGDKQLIGYIHDVIGSVHDPLYLVVLYPEFKARNDCG